MALMYNLKCVEIFKKKRDVKLPITITTLSNNTVRLDMLVGARQNRNKNKVEEVAIIIPQPAEFLHLIGQKAFIIYYILLYNRSFYRK